MLSAGGTSREMNFAPIDGLRMLAVETGLLVAFTLLMFVVFRFLRPSLSRPRWLEPILHSELRPVLFVIAAALVGRALLLPWVGVPQPHINDEFSYLLMGDTFSHFRLANPTPAAWQHFETFHVNLVPTYHSKYPVAQGLALAFGEILFRQPWVGIYVVTALLCGAICWVLQAFVSAEWALIGGLLAVVRLALFSYWMNSYWGGSMPALGGALALGAAVRLFDAERPERNRVLLASLFALGLLILATSRPFEGLAFSLPLLVYFAYKLLTGITRPEIRLLPIVLPVVLLGFGALGLMAHYNQRTTGDAFLMPYVLNERTYSSLPLFFGQHVTPPGPPHDPVYAKYYLVEAKEHDYQPDKPLSGIIAVQIRRVWKDWFFYVGPALSLPMLIGLLLCIKERRLWLVLAVALTTAAAVAACIFSQAHYFAPATVAVYVFAVAGLHYLWSNGGDAERAFATAVCLTVVVASLSRNSGSSTLNSTYPFPNTRELVARQLDQQPGKHLVLVSYDMERHYPGDELVHNAADFSSEKILWARSKGAGNDSDLCPAYSDRTFWSVTTDDVTFSLSPVDLCGSQPGFRASHPK